MNIGVHRKQFAFVIFYTRACIHTTNAVHNEMIQCIFSYLDILHDTLNFQWINL